MSKEPAKQQRMTTGQKDEDTDEDMEMKLYY